MPTGRELVELVKGTNSAIAQEEWEEAKRVASRGIEKLTEATTLSKTAKHAIRGIGGIKKIRLMTEKQETWLNFDHTTENKFGYILLSDFLTSA